MVLAGMMDASIFFDLHRLPELFCGFPRRSGRVAHTLIRWPAHRRRGLPALCFFWSKLPLAFG